MALKIASTVDEDEDRPPMKQIYRILEAFVTAEPAISVSTTAKEIDDIGCGRKDSIEGGEAVEPYTFLMRFWEVTVPLAYQIPYNHPSQDRLNQLILALSSFPTGHNEGPTTLHGRWRGLHGMDETLQDIWREPEPNEDDPPDMSQWVNLNSFVARLYREGLFDSARFPIWALRYCFESRGGGSPAVLEMRILTAGQWIVHSADALLAMMKHKAANEDEIRLYKSPFFKDQQVLSMDRWEFWKQKFLIASDEDEEDLSQAAKAVAASAVKAMIEAETSQ